MPIDNEVAMDELSDSSRGAPASAPVIDRITFYQAPFNSPAIRDEYPPLVVLKTGGVFSAARYWTKNKRFYFVTTQGDTGSVPLSLLERVYPRVKQASK
jgi:hypothetical protein